MITKEELIQGLKDIGVEAEMILEVHCSLKSFGYVEGGAITVIDALKEVVGKNGSIFMPALSLSKECELSEFDKQLGITSKIQILPRDTKRTAMGIVADTFRSLPDTYTSHEVIATSGWGKHGKEAIIGGLDYAIAHSGKALLLGVDIYKLTAMHYVEDATPVDINNRYAPTEEINSIYPPDEWMIEKGHPPVKAWYKVYEKAYQQGLITEGKIGDCKVLFFDIKKVISIYEHELKTNPYKFWEIND